MFQIYFMTFLIFKLYHGQFQIDLRVVGLNIILTWREMEIMVLTRWVTQMHELRN